MAIKDEKSFFKCVKDEFFTFASTQIFEIYCPYFMGSLTYKPKFFVYPYLGIRSVISMNLMGEGCLIKQEGIRDFLTQP